jgi:hypothetical protein
LVRQRNLIITDPTPFRQGLKSSGNKMNHLKIITVVKYKVSSAFSLLSLSFLASIPIPFVFLLCHWLPLLSHLYLLLFISPAFKCYSRIYPKSSTLLLIWWFLSSYGFKDNLYGEYPQNYIFPLSSSFISKLIIHLDARGILNLKDNCNSGFSYLNTTSCLLLFILENGSIVLLITQSKT